MLKVEFDQEDDGRWIAEDSGPTGRDGLWCYR